MVRKKLATAILAISAMQAGWVSALGLGEATLKSSLNQPLVAEIYINDLGDLSADQLVIKMASAEDFSRAGVERAFFLSSIKFDIRMDGRGGGVVRMVTREPVNEPYLNFVVEARWPAGRMLREYTLLLDLPVFSQGGTGAIDSASTSAVGAAVELADQAPETAVYNQPRRISRPAAATSYTPVGDGQHRVESNETLWRIASNNRPEGATVQQTVVAIHRMNPEAFANGNMNLMKAGAVLRLPTAADVEAIGDQDAAVEIAQSRNNTQESAPVERGPDLDARATEESAPSAPVEDSRLSIATPKEAASKGEGSAAGGESGSSELRDQLGAAQENLDRVQREKSELENRVGDMERQMGTLQKILQLKEEQLNALQSQAEQSSAKSEEPATAPVTPEATVPAPQAEKPVVAPEPKVETPPAPAPQPAIELKPAATQAAEQSLIDQVMGNTVALFGIVVVGFGAIAALMYRRRKESAEEREVESLLATEELAADALETETALASISAAQYESTDTQVSTASASETESVASKTTAQTSDPIAEADIYVAYGRYPQAIDLLQNAIRNEPARTEYHVKLLEVYLETQDKAGFQAQFAQLQSLGDYTAIGRVKELMSAFDGVEGWLDTKDLIQDDDTDHHHDIADEALLNKGSYQASSTAFAETNHDDELTLDLDDEPVKAEEGLSLDLTDFETENNNLSLDNELTLDVSSNELSFDETHHDISSAEEILTTDLSFDDDLMHGDHAEKALAEEAPEFLADEETVPEFDGGFADDLEKSLQDEGIEDDPLALDKGIGQLEEFGQLEELGQLDELGELDEFDQALNELDTNTDLESLDSEFGDLLNEASPDLALSETETSLELPAEFDTELPETLDFSSPDKLVSVNESDDVALDADLDFGDLESAAELSSVESVSSTAEEVATADSAQEDSSDEFDFADSDEVATKLDLARAYIDMGDSDGAKEILDEVLAEGNDEQKGQASELLAKIA